MSLIPLIIATFANSGTSLVSKRAADSNTLALFPFLDGSGTTATDASSHHNAVLHGGCNWVTSGISLDGSNNTFIAVPGLLDTIPDAGTISLQFKLNSGLATFARLFTKYTAANTGIDVYINTDGSVKLVLVKAGTTSVYTSGVQVWTVGAKYDVLLRWNTWYIELWLNGAKIITARMAYPLASGSFWPFIIGANSDGTTSNQVLPATIEQFFVLNREVSTDEIASIRTYTPLIPRLQWDKFSPAGGSLISNALSNGVAENSVIPEEDGTVTIFHTCITDDHTNQIGYMTAPSMAGPWTTPVKVIGKGLGGAPSDRQASSNGARKIAGTYYVFALNGYGFPGEDRKIYLYTATDKNSFTSQGAMFTQAMFPGLVGFGNTSFIPEKINNKWIAVIDAFTENNIWEMHRAEADNLTGPWTITHRLTSCQVASACMYGSPSLHYFGGKYHLWYHATGVQSGEIGNLPCVLVYAQSDDSINWTRKEVPIRNIVKQPYAGFFVEQSPVDPDVNEIGGKVYLTYGYTLNDNGTPIGTGKSTNNSIWVESFNGTFDQLVSGI